MASLTGELAEAGRLTGQLANWPSLGASGGVLSHCVSLRPKRKPGSAEVLPLVGVCVRAQVQRRVAVIPKSVTLARIRQNLAEPWTFRLSEQELAALAAIDDGARFCSPPWSTFGDRTRADDVLTGCLTRLARGIFSVASLDITK